MPVLFMTSNGTGLGHLTRGMAIARRLEPGIEPAFFTLSAAAPVVRGQGYLVEYMGSYDTPGAGSHLEWSRRLQARLAGLLATLRPAVLVFDGAHPYPAAIRAMREHPDVTTIWSRRPMWKAGRGRAMLALAPAFDLVLEPGELAGGIDSGLTAERRDEAVRLGPITLCDDSELLSRAEAERALGLDPGRVNALVSLGQGPEVDAAVRRCLARLAPEPELQVAALESSISPRLELPEGVVTLRDTYPVSRYLRAFDFAVSAAGYNAYHELIDHAVPTVFVAMPRELDDQAARARHADAVGVALACDGPGSDRLEGLVERMLDPELRAAISARARGLGVANGATEAARLISRLAAREPAALAGLPRPRRRGAAMRTTLARAQASALIRHPLERRRSPRPEIACLAFGVSQDRLEAALERLLAECSEPRRLLVLTDSAAFGLLRRAGVVVEYVPPAAEVERHLPELDYDELLDARVEGILRERQPGSIEVLR
jgi:UDP:flavonoid glycosyltransferase YjiC (YdhE family)